MEFISYTVGEQTLAFNKAWVASKTLKEFSDHEKHHGLSAEQYKEIHDICTGKKTDPVKTEVAKSE